MSLIMAFSRRYGLSFRKSLTLKSTLKEARFCTSSRGEDSADDVNNIASGGTLTQDIDQDYTKTESADEAAKGKKTLDETTPVSSAEIKRFLWHHDLKFREKWTGFWTTCPRFKHEYDENGVDKLYINKKTGYFKCSACGRSGCWHHICQHVESFKSNKTVPEKCFDGIKLPPERVLSKLHQNVFESFKPVREVSDHVLDNILEKLEMKLLTRETLDKFGARIDEDSNSLLLPWYSLSNQLVAFKRIRMETGKGDKEKIKKIPSGKIDTTVFGLQSLSESSARLVLVEDETDVMAIYQSTAVAAIAIAKGTLPQQVLPEIERYKRIDIWVDDKSGNAAAFARKLDEGRCFVLRKTKEQPNAYKAFEKCDDLRSVLSQAKPVKNGFIISFQDLREDVKSDLLNAEEIQGVKWKRFAKLNDILKGHRRGELTILTGPTGSGKTTFISEYTLDLCESGVRTLWGSFEISNKRLLRIMLRQYAGFSLEENVQEFDTVADEFEALPMYFMTFHGQENIERVIQTMSHAAYVKDIEHVIVDNLQFMMGLDNQPSMDRYWKQDNFIAEFRKFATVMDCHVTLVIHPRKEKDEELTLQSIFGSAKSSQEADNVLILQHKRFSPGKSKKYLEVVKNRYEGELGIMLLNFRKQALSFAPKSKEMPSKESEKVLLEYAEEFT